MNLSGYFKEQIAVVTNPAIDREREQEHFSTQVIIGPRPSLHTSALADTPPHIVLDVPIVVGGHRAPLLPPDNYRKLAAEHGTLSLEDLVAAFDRSEVAILSLSTKPRSRSGLQPTAWRARLWRPQRKGPG